MLELHQEGIDLIYEGITTSVMISFSSELNKKELTWFMKGLRLSKTSNYIIKLNWEGIDLIYEGITTTPYPYLYWR